MEILPQEIERLPTVGTTAWAVYVYLAWCYDRGQRDPSYTQIAVATGASRGTVSKALDVLRHNGMVIVVRKYQCNNSYLLPLRGPVPIEEIPSPQLTLPDMPPIEKSTRSFDLADAQSLLNRVTGWPTPPGTPDEALHLLGIVCSIHDVHKENTEAYLTEYFKEFRKRYPSGTRTFWLTDWAVQDRLPKQRKQSQPEPVVYPETGKTSGEIFLME